MPEGHTIHRLANQHRSRFVGEVVQVSSPQGRFLDAERLDGRQMVRAEAFGKHLLFEFEGRRFVHVHLGLFGRFLTGAQPAPNPGPSVRMRLEVGDWYSDLVGATRCQLIDGDQRASLIARLGPDPLRRGADPARAYARLSRSTQPIGLLLMDQSVVAGIGNVYRAELLFLAGLDPYRPGQHVEASTWDGIWNNARSLMRAGVRSGRIITTDPRDREHLGRLVRPSDAHYVYKRAGQWCRRCHKNVRAADLAGRVLYWCPTCQS
ncbi:MAG TPA: DNA-formamidopyrimidine glycosylase family protein [Actinomycetes bacterium]|nr:DNA-formamidopyrimidine glycosylase family protein [Actinomycetes bacterium]